ncbi:integrase core domain-containing protein [Streptomyces sp. NPDC005065]|uniref:integrase core domain-containing protein n=1 Tax=Streptomyces sp. NPDC005065 TaxID=3154461 RepID=UPI0033BC0259
MPPRVWRVWRTGRAGRRRVRIRRLPRWRRPWRELLDGCGAFERIGAAQAALDAWVEECNSSRPHQALDMQSPADRFTPVPERERGCAGRERARSTGTGAATAVGSCGAGSGRSSACSCQSV